MSGAPANRAWWLAVVAIAAQLSLGGCGGGSSAASGGAANAFSLSAKISGLDSSGLVLFANGNAVTVTSGTTTQVLASSLASGTPYSVSVSAQPTGETCSVSSNSGTISSANGSVVVTCSAQAYTLGGSIVGLTTAGLVLVNGGVTLMVTSGSNNFEFATPIAEGSPYVVSVQTQPLGLTCTLVNNAGPMATGNVTNVVVNCAANTYTVGGSITGLAAAGLVLQDNGGDVTSIDANAASFTLHTGVVYGGPYAVTVQTQPVGLACTVSNGSGTVGAANVTNITIACLTNTKIIYSFAGAPSSGLYPYGALIQGMNGDLYGTTEEGGSSDLGTVFMVSPSDGTASLLHSFTGIPADGANPYGGLVQDSRGTLYGTTEAGGVYMNCFGYTCDFSFGTVFEIDASTNTEGTAYSFEGNTNPFQDGGSPYAGLTQGSGGILYGTTQQGGSSGNGTVFKFNSNNNAATLLHAFAGGTSDGAAPYAALTLASDGNLYGTTQRGGASAAGTVFRINPNNGAESVVYSFAGGSADGASPYGGLIQAKDGNLYGTTGSGGASGVGVVFKINPSSGAESVVYAFAGGSSDGANPYAGLMQATDGNLYGTTVSGGASNNGTVFRVNPGTGVEILVYAFAGSSSDGANPYGGLIQASDGNLYGTTLKGGSSGAGTVYQVSLQ